MTVFMSVACGAARSSEPSPYALCSANTVAAMPQHAKAAPRNCPICCFAGVAPTSCPVFRSCEMSPALDAAMQTTVPTVRIAARAEGSVQPQATNTTDTPSSVTSAMPEVGLDETPMRPTMRDETTTNASPKIATPQAATKRGPALMPPASRPGMANSAITTRAGPASTIQPGTSRSVRGTACSVPPLPLRSPAMTAARERYMVGIERATVTMPASATAPAPM